MLRSANIAYYVTSGIWRTGLTRTVNSLKGYIVPARVVYESTISPWTGLDVLVGGLVCRGFAFTLQYIERRSTVEVHTKVLRLLT